MLRAELGRREPEQAPDLHRRASRWFASAGDADAAARHARAAGDLDRAATLVWAAVPGRLGRGDVAAVERSLAHFTEEETAARAPLALAAAWCALERGGGTAEDWIAAAEHPDGRAPQAAVALLRAAAAGTDPRGCARTRRWPSAARRRSPWRAMARLHEGIAHELAGDRAAARSALEDGAHRASARMPAVAARCLSRLALLALEEDADPHAAARLALRARGLGARPAVPENAPTAMVHAACALVLARAGRADEARSHLDRGTVLLGRVLSPWLAVDARVVMARAAALLGNLAAARELLGEAAAMVPHEGGAEVLRERLEAAREAALPSGGDGAARDALTTAEMRILGYLPTPPLLPGDRRAAERVPLHREDPGDGRVPQARRVVAGGGGGPGAGDRPPGLTRRGVTPAAPPRRPRPRTAPGAPAPRRGGGT